MTSLSPFSLPTANSSDSRHAEQNAAGSARVCVVVLNWNGWHDTIECLESVLRSQYPNYQVVVIDNGSMDGSLERIRSWAEGHWTLDIDPQHPLCNFTTPAVRKPLSYCELSSAEVRAGVSAPADIPLVFVRSERNLGFAGGANLGLLYALVSGCLYGWVLNNDTVVCPDALAHLIERVERDPAIGLCGSTLLFYDQPETVQALGGFRYNVWFGVATQIAQGRRCSAGTAPPLDEQSVEAAMFGVQGASVLVSRSFLEEVGLLSEEYFLYSEEQDWAVRARQAGYRLGYAARSVVYHKEGRSTGNRSLARNTRSYASDFYQIQARLLFTRRFYPLALPTVYFGLAGAVVNRLRRGQLRRIPMMLDLMFRTLFSSAPRRLEDHKVLAEVRPLGEAFARVAR